MKRIFHLIAFVFCAQAAQSECYYSNYQLKISIRTSDEVNHIVYQDISKCYFDLDSIGKIDYLIVALSKNSNSDSLFIYKNRIGYAYCIGSDLECPDSSKTVIYDLLNESFFLKNEIKSITITDYVETPAFNYIASSVNLDDSVWLKSRPIAAYNFYAYLCDHTIVVHKQQEKTDKIIAEINAFQAEIDELHNTGEVDSQNGDELDHKMQTLIDQLIPFKYIVIVSGCTD